jgi:hypothetical protein
LPTTYLNASPPIPATTNPTQWSTQHRNSFVRIDADGLEAVCGETAARPSFLLGDIESPSGLSKGLWGSLCVAQADHPFSGGIYFEVEIVNDGEKQVVGIGLSNGIASLDGLPGWLGHQSWGYHGDDGGVYVASSNYQQTEYEKYGKGDILHQKWEEAGLVFSPGSCTNLTSMTITIRLSIQE